MRSSVQISPVDQQPANTTAGAQLATLDASPDRALADRQQPRRFGDTDQLAADLPHRFFQSVARYPAQVATELAPFPFSTKTPATVFTGDWRQGGGYLFS